MRVNDQIVPSWTFFDESRTYRWSRFEVEGLACLSMYDISNVSLRFDTNTEIS
jgi:hypothetical protein